MASIKITQKELNAIIGLREDIETMIGTGGPESHESDWLKWIKAIDRMLKRNRKELAKLS